MFVSTPDIAENGAVVPIGVATTLPGVRRMLILVEKNPNTLSADRYHPSADGDRVWAFRYSSEGRSRSLFHSADVLTLRAQRERLGDHLLVAAGHEESPSSAPVRFQYDGDRCSRAQ